MSKAKRRTIKEAKQKRDEKEGVVTVKAPISFGDEKGVSEKAAIITALLDKCRNDGESATAQNEGIFMMNVQKEFLYGIFKILLPSVLETAESANFMSNLAEEIKQSNTVIFRLHK